MLRRLFIGIISVLPPAVVWVFSKKYIAGKTLEKALITVKKLNKQGADTTLDVLGEHQDTRKVIELNIATYTRLIHVASENKLQTSFSVKPTMFGLQSDFDYCYQTIRELTKLAKKHNRLLRLDMEDATCTQLEIDLFKRLQTEFPQHIGLVLQAYLKRTLNDLQQLREHYKTPHPLNIRLCKGIYIEPEQIAYKKYAEINNNFISCLIYMIENNFYPAIATHDNALIAKALELIRTNKSPSNSYEFQMLYGVKTNLRNSLISEGHHVRIYVPFGEKWHAYSIRRLRENPQIALHIIKALIGIG